MPIDGVSIQQWHDAGFLVIPQFLSDVTVQELRLHSDLVFAGIYDLGRRPIIDPFARRANPKATQLVDNPHWADSAIRALALDPSIGEIAANLLGVDSVRLWATQMLLKPPSGPEHGHIGWHQDYDYWECAAPPAHMITAWLPLDDVDEVNGGLTFSVGSHKSGHLRLRAFLDDDLETQRQKIQQSIGRLPEFNIRLKAGGLSFHHCLTLHSSDGNSSPMPRRAISIHMMAASTRYRPGTSSDSHPNVLLIRRQADALFQGPNFPLIYPRR